VCCSPQDTSISFPLFFLRELLVLLSQLIRFDTTPFLFSSDNASLIEFFLPCNLLSNVLTHVFSFLPHTSVHRNQPLAFLPPSCFYVDHWWFRIWQSCSSPAWYGKTMVLPFLQGVSFCSPLPVLFPLWFLLSLCSLFLSESLYATSAIFHSFYGMN